MINLHKREAVTSWVHLFSIKMDTRIKHNAAVIPDF